MRKGIIKVSKALLEDVLHLDRIRIESVHLTDEDLRTNTLSFVVTGEEMPEVQPGQLIPQVDVVHTQTIKTEYKVTRPTWPPKLETR